MKKLPLYRSLPQALISTTTPIPVDPACTRCALHERKPRTVCMKGEGEAGGLLLIGEKPGRLEDQMGRPFVGPSGKYLRSLVLKWWSGPIAYDNAIKCDPADATPRTQEKAIDACRPYAAQILSIAKPKRIVCLGNAAVELLYGYHPPIMSVRRGYGWVFNEADDATPVFFLPNPAAALRNRFVKADFEEDLKWALAAKIPEPDFSSFTYLVENEADARAAAKALLLHEWIGYDVETSGMIGNPDFQIEACTLRGHSADYSYTWTRAALKNPKAVEPLRQLLQSSKVQKTTQNGKYDDRSMLGRYGIDVRAPRFDTRLGRKIMDPEADAKLETLAYLVGYGGHKKEAHEKLGAICTELRRQAFPKSALTPSGKPRKIKEALFDVEPAVLRQIVSGVEPMNVAYRYLDEETLYRYNARDVETTVYCGVKLEARIKTTPQLQRVWETLSRPANVAVRHMERWGIACDVAAVRHLAAYAQGKANAAMQAVHSYAPGLNLDSPPQVREFLFTKLKLKPIKQTASGADSTNASVLEALAGKHPALDEILTFRRYTKLDRTYATGMLPFIVTSGRIHPSILIDGTRTGRYSCADPNLQNLPRSEDGENQDAAMARNCFIAEPGYVLLELDYSQIELRVAALLSGDDVMIADFAAGIDIHMNNATLSCEAAFGISAARWAAMTKDQKKPYRSRIKTATFAKLYGKTTGALAREWGVSREEVEKIDRVIWGRYKKLARWCQAQIEKARRTGYVETWWDGAPAMRRPIYSIADNDDQKRRHGENEAVNTPVQGTAAHFMSASLGKIVPWLLEEGLPAKCVLTVHDSVVLEVKEKYVNEVAQGTKEIMTSHNSNGVVIAVDAKVGPAYGSMQDYKL